MKARYLRITPISQVGELEDIEISGFKLFNGANQVDISTSTVSLSFQPISGNKDMILRSSITIDEALVVPKSLTRGNSYIYIDLGVAKNFDAFQVGFGSTSKKSLLKLRIDYSTNALKYVTMVSIAQDIKLKFRTPWTFSLLSDNPSTGFPGFLDRAFFLKRGTESPDWSVSTSASNLISTYIDEKLRAFKSKRFSNNSNYIQWHYGNISFLPVSSYLQRGKFYFEVSSKSGVTDDNVAFFGIMLNNSDSGTYGLTEKSILFSLGSLSNGVLLKDGTLSVNKDILSTNIPPNYENTPGGRKGFLGGFVVDILGKKIQLINSPYTTDITFNNSDLKSSLNTLSTNSAARIYFFIVTPPSTPSYSSNNDFSFNFGQDPFIGPVPSDLVDRIGQRWEMEHDPTFIANNNFIDFGGSIKVECTEYRKPTTELTKVYNVRKNFLIDSFLTHYIKGHVSSINGVFNKRELRLFYFPQMELVASTTSSTVDGTYEFLYLEDRDYVIISNDTFSNAYQNEILGPLKPKPMDPTL